MSQPPVILVVDDDFHVTEVLEFLLRSEGFTPVCAADGEEALLCLKRHLPALVLLDIMLPNLGGFGVLEALRADPRTKTVPVIVLSAKDLVAEVETAFEKGANDYVHKPFTPDRLMVKIRKHLGPGTPR